VHHCNSLKTKDQLNVTCCFYFTSYALNMFWTLIYPSSGGYDFSVGLPHWSCVLGSMCIGVLVWLGWRGIRVAGWSTCFRLLHGYHTNLTTPKHQHTSNQECTTSVVIQHNSRKLPMMDILMSETRWAHRKWNKKASDIKLVFCFQIQHLYISFHYDNMFPSTDHQPGRLCTTQDKVQHGANNILVIWDPIKLTKLSNLFSLQCFNDPELRWQVVKQQFRGTWADDWPLIG